MCFALCCLSSVQMFLFQGRRELEVNKDTFRKSPRTARGMPNICKDRPRYRTWEILLTTETKSSVQLENKHSSKCHKVCGF